MLSEICFPVGGSTASCVGVYKKFQLHSWLPYRINIFSQALYLPTEVTLSLTSLYHKCNYFLLMTEHHRILRASERREEDSEWGGPNTEAGFALSGAGVEEVQNLHF